MWPQDILNIHAVENKLFIVPMWEQFERLAANERLPFISRFRANSLHIYLDLQGRLACYGSSPYLAMIESKLLAEHFADRRKRLWSMIIAIVLFYKVIHWKEHEKVSLSCHFYYHFVLQTCLKHASGNGSVGHSLDFLFPETRLMIKLLEINAKKYLITKRNS